MKNNIVRVRLNLNKTNDKDIIERLDKQPNKNGYIKQLIREDIKNNPGE